MDAITVLTSNEDNFSSNMVNPDLFNYRKSVNAQTVAKIVGVSYQLVMQYKDQKDSLLQWVKLNGAVNFDSDSAIAWKNQRDNEASMQGLSTRLDAYNQYTQAIAKATERITKLTAKIEALKLTSEQIEQAKQLPIIESEETSL